MKAAYTTFQNGQSIYNIRISKSTTNTKKSTKEPTSNKITSQKFKAPRAAKIHQRIKAQSIMTSNNIKTLLVVVKLLDLKDLE